MSDNLTPEQIQELLKKLEEQNQELEILRQQKVIVQPATQDNLLQNLIEKGAPFIMEYMKMSSESERYSVDKDVELEKEELKIIDKLDTKEKFYKGILLFTCLAALILSALFIEKAEVVIPVLSLIIGLLFKSNTLSDFFSHAKRKLNNNDDE
ncbi:MAG: hypothetical protein ACK5QC_01560 [Bacteroidota bacterium]